MNRREFTASIGLGAIALGLGRSSKMTGTPPPDKAKPEIAITMDDFVWNKTVKLAPERRNRAILGALKSHGNLKAALFVAGKNADNETGQTLLRERDKAGHLIGNHSYSHNYNLLNALFLGDLLDMFKGNGWKLVDATEAFKDPVFSSEPKIVPAGESIIWALAKETGKFEKLLRYPG